MIKLLISAGLISIISTVAHADVVLIANNNLPADNIDKTLAANVFLGKAFALPDGTRLIPLERPKADPAKAIFHEQVTGKSLAQLNAYWSRLIFTGKNAPPNEIDDDDEVIELILDNENLIGYVNRESLSEGVKVVLSVGD